MPLTLEDNRMLGIFMGSNYQNFTSNLLLILTCEKSKWMSSSYPTCTYFSLSLWLVVSSYNWSRAPPLLGLQLKSSPLKRVSKEPTMLGGGGAQLVKSLTTLFPIIIYKILIEKQIAEMGLNFFPLIKRQTKPIVEKM